MAEILVTTTNDLAGFRIVRHIGVARGVVVRSRNIVAGIGAFLQTIKGGNITIYTKLAEDARADAHEKLLAHARELGANAVLALRYDANEINAGVTEVLAYGTAVVVEPLQL
ncbi:MAG: heavy metal-binding domain-containing protein [Hyphomicrobiaceae bacterium]